MRTVAFVFACLTCTGHGRRVQTKFADDSQELQSKMEDGTRSAAKSLGETLAAFNPTGIRAGLNSNSPNIVASKPAVARSDQSSVLMGRGDRRTKRGKRKIGSFGVYRPTTKKKRDLRRNPKPLLEKHMWVDGDGEWNDEVISEEEFNAFNAGEDTSRFAKVFTDDDDEDEDFDDDFDGEEVKPKPTKKKAEEQPAPEEPEEEENEPAPAEPEVVEEPAPAEPEEEPAAAEPEEAEEPAPAEPEEELAPAEPEAVEEPVAEPEVAEEPAPAEPEVAEEPAPAEPEAVEEPAPAEPEAVEEPASAEPEAAVEPAAAEPAAVEKPAPAVITIIAKPLSGESFEVEIDTGEKVEVLKAKIAEMKPEFPADQTKFLHSGDTLADDKQILDYGVKPGAFVVLLPPKGKATADASDPEPAAAPAPVEEEPAAAEPEAAGEAAPAEPEAAQEAPAEPEVVPVPEAFLSSREPWLKDVDEYKSMYKRSLEDPAGFWGDIAETFHWEKKWDTVVDSNFDSKKGKVFTEWFKGGKTNLCYNALDRHVEAGNGAKVAFYHESNEEGDEMKTWTYADVLEEVKKLGSYLKEQGVKPGDTVTIFMPMVPQLPMAMLACARIGAVHSVVFGGFSAEALSNRLLDAKSEVVITCNGVMRGAKPVALYETVKAGAKLSAEAGQVVKTAVVLQRLDDEKMSTELREEDKWWHDVVPEASADCPVEWREAEDPLFVLYTSGSTGKPKGVVHSTGGYMVYTATTSKYIFDLHPDDVFFCTADCGWITGHSYVAYGPMLNGATQLVFEGVPSYPDNGRLWRAVDKYKVTQLYTAPTAIRALMRTGEEPVKAASRESLKLLGSVGEPINPEAWRWYHKVVGDGRCPIVDTWWQTETGGIMIAPQPTKGFDEKPGSASLPFFGVEPVLITPEGKELEGATEGMLAIKSPWPSTIRDVLGDYERFQTTYFPIDGFYLTGDGARRDEDGYIWITGRLDDVINSAGHRIGTAEVESAVVLHPDVAEAAVVGYPHDVKGEGIYVYTTLNAGVEPSDDLKKELVMKCRKEIGPIASPDVIHWAPGLPKTRSGKIMRRILRKIAANQVDPDDLGDTSTLADPSVVDDLVESRPNK